ncbi:hypothetical protein HBI22_183070 [Parastagonospora nodorum]|nr:hypothetical protein HBI22_183070 [Parastagonospora nodorum]
MVSLTEAFTALERLGLDIPLSPTLDYDNPLDDASMSLLKKMNLKALDLYFFLPQDRDTVFAPKHFSNTLPRPALDVDGTFKATCAIAETISNAQRQLLQILTMHISCEGSGSHEAKIQLRRQDRDDASSIGVEKYRVIKRCEWRKFDECDTDDLRVFDLDCEE